MTTDPEGELKARFLETFLKQNPEVSSRLMAAVLRLPRSAFFPDTPVERLYGNHRPSGWGSRISPTLGEVARNVSHDGIGLAQSQFQLSHDGSFPGEDVPERREDVNLSKRS